MNWSKLGWSFLIALVIVCSIDIIVRLAGWLFESGYGSAIVYLCTVPLLTRIIYKGKEST